MKYISFILSLLLFQQFYAQINLVPNPSFEIHDSCKNSMFGKIYYAIPWFQPNTCWGPGGSSDYYNACGSSDLSGVPKNYPGYQNAKTGIAYAGIGVSFVGYNDGREYIEVQLNDSLVGGLEYCVKFFVSKGEIFYDNIDVIGAYFSIDSLVYCDGSLLYLPYQPQVVNASGNTISDTANWVLISGEFIASGGERYLTIGNFYPDSLTSHDTTAGAAYYYIDDVSVMLCDDTCKSTPPVAKYNYTDTGLTVNFNNLSTAASNNWLWYFGDGTSDTSQFPVHAYDSAGVYTVTLIACADNCCDTFEAQVGVNEVGVKESGVQSSEFGVFPNPAIGEITVTADRGNEINLFDITGRNIYHSKIFTSITKISTNEFENGIYYLCITNGNSVLVTKKIVLAR